MSDTYYFIWEDGGNMDGEFYNTRSDLVDALCYAGSGAEVYRFNPFKPEGTTKITDEAVWWLLEEFGGDPDSMPSILEHHHGSEYILQHEAGLRERREERADYRASVL